MSTTTLFHEYHAVENSPLMIDRFLRDPDLVWRQIKLEYRLNELIVRMLANSAIALACYGAVVGASHSVWQALSSAIKLPLLFLLTLAICLPTLYLFNLLCGGRLSARQALALVLVAITVTASLMLAFAPIAVFFMVTARSYPLFILLNVAILTLTGTMGLWFLVNGIRSLNALALSDVVSAEDQRLGTVAGSGRRGHVNITLLRTWLLLYGIVGAQLGWTLRPFFGDPRQPFIFFRAIKGNFFTAVVEIILRLIS